MFEHAVNASTRVRGPMSGSRSAASSVSEYGFSAVSVRGRQVLMTAPRRAARCFHGPLLAER
jgi:hypothetical protein